MRSHVYSSCILFICKAIAYNVPLYSYNVYYNDQTCYIAIKINNFHLRVEINNVRLFNNLIL